MAAEKDTENRLIHLEEKLLFQEDALHKLDSVVAKQYELIDKLQFQVKQQNETIENLREVIEEKLSGEVSNEKPPHY